MWVYEKKLIFPVSIGKPDPRMAKKLQMLLGGANGEFTASTTYLNQRYCMPLDSIKALLTDIGTEELSHVEMLSVMITQLLCGATRAQLEESGMSCHAISHGTCPFIADCAGVPWSAEYVGTTGDPIADITNDLAAEEKARAGYEGVMRFTDDNSVKCCLSFLREREIVHYQRFGEALNILNDAKDRGVF